jgi:hypothetical protein
MATRHLLRRGDDVTPGLPDFASFVERFGDEAAEVIWLAGCAWLERSAAAARDTLDNRFRWYPKGELDRLRREIAAALQLLRFASAVQAEENDMLTALMRPIREEAAAKAKAKRRDGTLEAERVRLENAAARRRSKVDGSTSKRNGKP